MTGHRRPSSIESFWEHCSGLEEWRDHPALNDSNIKWSSFCVPTLCQEFWFVCVYFYELKKKQMVVALVGFSSSIYPGLIPIILHEDGAEFYSNSEFVVFSMGSGLCDGVHVWDGKFPLLCIAYSSMYDNEVRKQVHRIVSQVIAWSLDCCTSGVFPSHGPWGEELTGERRNWSGEEVAGCYRGAYWGFRSDAKSRRESNDFPRSYLHSFICEQCLAQRSHKNWDERMSFKNFYSTTAHKMTQISILYSFSKVFGNIYCHSNQG